MAADAVLFITDADSGVTPADQEVAQILKSVGFAAEAVAKALKERGVWKHGEPAPHPNAALPPQGAQ